VSCSVHDLVRLERRGIPTVGIGTIPFADEALEQARLLGMPDLRMLLVAHPVQLLEPDELDALADDVFDRLLHQLGSDGVDSA
jgi:hypothetical protein